MVGSSLYTTPVTVFLRFTSVAMYALNHVRHLSFP